MSRLLSRFGIGGVTVETRLTEPALTPGRAAPVTVALEGGDATQAIDAITLSLMTSDGHERVLDRYDLATGITLDAGAARSLSADLSIPPWTPVTKGELRVWLRTALDIPWAVDPSDEAAVQVEPAPVMAALFEAVEALGFTFQASELREPIWLATNSFAQAFSFAPGSNVYRSGIEALTLVLEPRDTDVHGTVVIDEREPAESDTDIAFDRQEIPTTFESTSPNLLQRRLATIIDKHSHD